ncbi:MAG TPA: TetR/AcrR family transcriptional regulator [Myxococcaceae bacterium]|nr:TetR/AcrR family transcriptional regulator [Myxococcaceae bacterium]
MAPHRKRPRPRDATATREVLLDAATLVFAEKGFAGARVDEIAARAGANKALIYAYYGDKSGIYRAVLSSRLGEFADPALSEALAAEVSPRRALEEIVRRFLRMLIRDRAFSRLLAWDLLSNGRSGREIILDSSGPLLELISDLVRRGRAAGELRATTDPELFRSVLISLALGYPLQHSVMTLAREQAGLDYTDEQFVDYVCRILLEPDNALERRTA